MDFPVTSEVASRRLQGEIDLLLEEYRLLRAEVNERITGRMTLTGLLAASAALVAGLRHQPTWLYWLVGIAALVLVSGIWLWTWWRVDRLSRQLRSLERRINDRARRLFGTSEALLTWETDVRRRRARRGSAVGSADPGPPP